MSFPRENARPTAALDGNDVLCFMNSSQNLLLGKESGIQELPNSCSFVNFATIFLC